MKNTVCNQLDDEIGKLIHDEGEEWRNAHSDLIKAYEAHCTSGNVSDALSAELLADAEPDFMTQSIRVRCVSCQKEVQTTLGELRMKFARGSEWVTMLGSKTKHFKIPFTKYRFSIVRWLHERRFIK